MVVLNSPQNPTGGVIPPEDVRAIADMLRDRDVMVLSDEIYSRIITAPSRRFPSPASRACWRRPSSWTVFRRPTP